MIFQQQQKYSERDLDPLTPIVNSDFLNFLFFAKPHSGGPQGIHIHLVAIKALPYVTISSTMDFNVAKIASARASSTISLRVAGPLVSESGGQ